MTENTKKWHIIEMLLVAPEIYFVLSILFILLFHLTSFIKIENKNINNFSVVINLIIFTTINSLLLLLNTPSTSYSLFNNSYISNDLIFYFKIFLLSFFLLFLLSFRDYLLKNSINSVELLFVLSIYIASALLLVGFNDFIWLYLTLELNSICVYGILLIKRKNLSSVESIIKYFIISSVITAFLLYGMSILYLRTGSLNCYDFEIFFWNGSEDLFTLLGIAILFIGIILKLGVAPMHMWIFDLYKNLSYPVLLYLLIFPKFILVYIMFRFHLIFINTVFFILPLFLIIALLTTFFGIFFALFQSKLKEIFIFISISNISFFLIAFFLDTDDSYIYLFFFMFVYAINMFGIFISFSTLISWSDNKELTSIHNLAGLYRINPTLSFVLASFLFSLAGLPPLPGFLYKFYFLNSLFSNGHFSLYFLFMLLYVISAFYYMRIVKIIFINKNNKPLLLKPITRMQATILAIVTVLNISIFFFQSDIIAFLVDIFNDSN